MTVSVAKQSYEVNDTLLQVILRLVHANKTVVAIENLDRVSLLSLIFAI